MVFLHGRFFSQEAGCHAARPNALDQALNQAQAVSSASANSSPLKTKMPLQLRRQSCCTVQQKRLIVGDGMDTSHPLNRRPGSAELEHEYR
jgi:hypothetical protein